MERANCKFSRRRRCASKPLGDIPTGAGVGLNLFAAASRVADDSMNRSNTGTRQRFARTDVRISHGLRVAAESRFRHGSDFPNRWSDILLFVEVHTREHAASNQEVKSSISLKGFLPREVR